MPIQPISIKFKAVVVQLYTYVNKEGVVQNTFQFKKTTKFSNVAAWVLMMESSSGQYTKFPIMLMTQYA